MAQKFATFLEALFVILLVVGIGAALHSSLARRIRPQKIMCDPTSTLEHGCKNIFKGRQNVVEK